MKTMNAIKATMLLATVLFTVGCASDDTIENEQQAGNKMPAHAVVFSGENQAKPAYTRTTLSSHTKGSETAVEWEASDHVWVKDDAGVYQKSTITEIPNLQNKSIAMFGLTTGSFTGTNHSVVYTGKNSTSATEVEIKAEQTQTVTNSFAHLGESGDCGVATATKKPDGTYRFKLEHKAAYICIYPRIEEHDRLQKNVKLTKIVLVSSSGPIAGKYDFSTGTLGSTPTSDASNTITLTTPSGEISTTTRVDTSYYAVIAPGTHTLRAKYYITDPSTNVSKVVIKDLGTMTFTSGKFTDVTAWINKDLIEYNNYYAWDAKKPYWYGYESVQPFITGTSNPNYPQPGEERYEAFTMDGINNPLFTPNAPRHVPTMNELSWYFMKGDARWDSNGAYVFNGHLQQGGGVWFKKMERIKADNASLVAGAGGDVKAMGLNYGDAYHDYSANHSVYMLYVSTSNTIPTEEDQINYFFVPFSIPVYAGGVCLSRDGARDVQTAYWTTNREYMFHAVNNSLEMYTFGYPEGILGLPAVPML